MTATGGGAIRPRLTLALLLAALTINFLHRQTLSLVAPVLTEQLHLSNKQYGTIVFFFLLGMAIGQIPAGMFLDARGPRRGLSALVLFWSAVNFLHGFAGSVAQFSGLRFFMGLGQCGAYSGGIKTIGQTFKPEDRALAGGVFNCGSLLGPIIASPLIVWIATNYGWRSAFFYPSVLGIVWVVLWRVTQPRAVEEGLRAGVPNPLPLFAFSAVWGVMVIRAMGGPVNHFYWYWLPQYLKNERGFSLAAVGWYGALPYVTGAVGNLAGGWYARWLMSRGFSTHRARRTAFVTAVALTSASALVPLAPSPALALGLICIATLGMNVFSANFIGLLADLFAPRVLARLSGITGVADGLMSMTFIYATGVIVDRFSYMPVFIAAAAMPMIALASLFLLVGPIRRIEIGD